MLLSKEQLDGTQDGSVPLARPSSAAGARPSSSYGRGSFGSPTFSSTGGFGNDAQSIRNSVGTYDNLERGDELATPNGAANLRAKLQQQRQRAIAKKQQGPTPAAMVQSNEGLTVSEVATPMTRHSGSPGSTTVASTTDAAPSRPPLNSQWTVASLDALMNEDKEANSSVIPDTPQISKEEEEQREMQQKARRSNLTQDLIDRGICPVFDPTPLDGPPGGLGNGKVALDLGAMAPGELKAFLHEPVPRPAGMLQCRIVRDRSGLNKLYPKYRMESDAGVFMMQAQKQKQNKTSNYAICCSQSGGGKESEGFIGKLRSDFMGLEFVAYGPGLNPSKCSSKGPATEAIQQVREEMVAVQYSSSLWGSKPRGPRKMNIVIPRVQPNGERLICRTLHPESEGLVAMQKNGTANQLIDPYVNKSPKWNDQIGAYVLNFNKRVTQASVKNFQLCHAEDPDSVFLQFGRVDKEIFNIDFKYPMSAFQAFAICLSSFDYKLCCE
jgi:tubby-related protein 1